ncbi:acyltransferase domain-containing protein [Streptomyces sp. NPDC090741]|uniref:acyltransferase domain-containing protein n=1 Tax=Streptomyces sp. NPDC090741 TaxID=3365967 RepID=UPI003830E3D1
MSDDAAALLARRPRRPRPPRRSAAPPLTVLFTGHAGRRLALGRELYCAVPAFRTAYDGVRDALDPWLRLPLAAVVFAPEGGVDSGLIRRAEFAQPALFAFQVAVYRLWQSWGLRADAVAGQGAGELSAAHVAGVLTLADAARLVAVLGRLVPPRPAPGAARAAEAEFLKAARESATAPRSVHLVCTATGRAIGPGPDERPLRPERLLLQTHQVIRTADAVRTLEAAGFTRPHPCGPDPEDTLPGCELRAARAVLLHIEGPERTEGQAAGRHR